MTYMCGRALVSTATDEEGDTRDERPTRRGVHHRRRTSTLQRTPATRMSWNPRRRTPPTVDPVSGRRGRNVRARSKDIRDWIRTWNDGPMPYVGTKAAADQILDSVARYSPA